MMMIVKVVLFLVGLIVFFDGSSFLLAGKTVSHKMAALTVIALGGILMGSAFMLEAIDKARKSVDKTWKLLRDRRDKLDSDES